MALPQDTALSDETLPADEALAAVPAALPVTSAHFRSVCGAECCWITAERADVVYVKLLFESYEGLAFTRTVEPHFGDGRLLMVVLTTPDLVVEAADALNWLADRSVVTPLESSDALQRDLERELLDT